MGRTRAALGGSQQLGQEREIPTSPPGLAPHLHLCYTYCVCPRSSRGA